MKRILTPALAGLALMSSVAAGCAALPGFTTPPIDTPKQTSTFTMGDLWPGAPEAPLVPVVVPTDLAPYRVKEGEGGMAIDVPSQAQSLNIASGVLHLKLDSQMKIRLGFKFYLAKENPYATDPIGQVEIGPGESKQVDMAFDTSLLKNPKIYSGVQVQVLQSDAAMAKKSDTLTATVWATLTIKVL